MRLKTAMMTIGLTVFSMMVFAQSEQPSTSTVKAEDMTAQKKATEEVLKTARRLCGEKKYREAMPLIEEATDSGSAEAQFLIGKLLMEGNGVKKNQEEAIAWLKKAAAQDYGEAHFYLGLAWSKGKGVPKDEYTACRYFYRALRVGFSEAQEYIDKMSNDGMQVQRIYMAEVGMETSCANIKSYVVAVTTEKEFFEQEGFACGTVNGTGILSYSVRNDITTVIFGACTDPSDEISSYTMISEGQGFSATAPYQEGSPRIWLKVIFSEAEKLRKTGANVEFEYTGCKVTEEKNLHFSLRAYRYKGRLLFMTQRSTFPVERFVFTNGTGYNEAICKLVFEKGLLKSVDWIQ